MVDVQQYSVTEIYPLYFKDFITRRKTQLITICMFMWKFSVQLSRKEKKYFLIIWLLFYFCFWNGKVQINLRQLIDVHSSWETMHKSYDNFAEITFLTIKGEEYITYLLKVRITYLLMLVSRWEFVTER